MVKIKQFATTAKGQLTIVFLLSFVFFSFVVPKEFTSSSVFLVKSLSEEQAAPTGLELINSTIPTNTTTPVIQAYVESPSLAKKLNQDLDFFSHIKSGQGLVSYFLYRSGLDEYFEKTTNFIELTTGMSDDVLILNTTAFSPQMAFDVNLKSMEAIEALVERVNEEKVGARLVNAEKIVTETQEELTQANVALDAYRSKHNVISPAVDVELSRKHVASLESELVLTKAALAEKLEYLNPTAVEIKQLNGKIVALQSRIESENSSLVGLAASHEYIELQFDVDMATKANQMAVASLEQLRVESIKSTVTIVQISESTKPTKATYPSVLFHSINLTVIAMVLIALFKMVREQVFERKKK
ncbi:hypothetical protein [Vibrio sp. D431a]|uniref:hypothetical protein n=1 Tax=Vibrio sp. D431a TaxID=2837388 RepID=UPI002556D57B|nr:hypothetical protein [Vibrio sp. D431a]MDK9790728.1 hypothetical protein [Vibrio sp. D431a]